MKIKVGDKVKMTKEAQQQFFPKGTLFINGIVKEVFPDSQIRVQRYTEDGSDYYFYRGHEDTLWLRSWWRLSR